MPLGSVEVSFTVQHGRLWSTGSEFVLVCLLNSHLVQFKLTQHFSEDEVAHW
jgi:hypothetical protein